MRLLNDQYIDIIDNYDLFRDYLEYNLGISEETINFAFDTYGLNEETFENLVEWVGGDWDDFEEYMKENREDYEEETEEEEEEEEEEDDTEEETK